MALRGIFTNELKTILFVPSIRDGVEDILHGNIRALLEENPHSVYSALGRYIREELLPELDVLSKSETTETHLEFPGDST